MTSNKRKGTAFEAEMCEILSSLGFWVHNFADRKNGQPVDIISSGHGVTEIADCKVCDKGFFDTSRIEENQEYSIRKWFWCGNRCAAIYFKMPNGDIYKYIMTDTLHLNQLLDKKRLKEDEIRALPRWNGRCFDWE